MALSLEQVAEAISYCERAHIFPSQAATKLSDPGLLRRHGFSPIDATAAVRSFRLNGVVLDAAGALLFKDGEPIKDTRYLLPDGYNHMPAAETTIILPDGVDYVLGYNRGHESYHHWLIQCLPAIDWALRQPRNRPLRLILPPLEKWQEELIRLLGYGPIPCITIEGGRCYYFPQLDYAEYLNGSVTFGLVTTVYDAARRILTNLPPSSYGQNPILYVPSSSSYIGKLVNESEVIELFKRFGAIIVDQDLPTTTRINLFRNAKVVAGPFGTKLADVLFCCPGTLLWEFMPRHHQNAVINRCAQIAQVDYWGDVFESEAGAGMPRNWSADLGIVRHRLVEVSDRLVHQAAEGYKPVLYKAVRRSALPIDELMMAFENLGENCDFGLIQRHARAEPIGIFRFSGNKLPRLLETLNNDFQGVGDPENLRVVLAGEAPNREYMVAEKSIGGYHTFILEGQMKADEVAVSQARHLKFLRRKILEDLKAGEKIWVWRELNASDPEKIFELLQTLRRFGPNRLLWATMGDETKPPGTVEQLDPNLIRGYVRPVPRIGEDDSFPSRSWFQVCETAYCIWHPEIVQVDIGNSEGSPPLEPIAVSAMDILRRAAISEPDSAIRLMSPVKASFIQDLFSGVSKYTRFMRRVSGRDTQP